MSERCNCDLFDSLEVDDIGYLLLHAIREWRNPVETGIISSNDDWKLDGPDSLTNPPETPEDVFKE